MTTLTQTAYYTRRVIAFLGIFLVTIIVGRALLNAGQALFNSLRREPPPEPTLAFGKLPQLKFPERENIPELTIELETIEGRLPAFGEIYKVYFMPQKNVSLLSLEQAKATASKIGFKNEPEQIGNVLYRWETNDPPTSYLEMDINLENFHYRHNFEETPTFIGRINISQEDDMVKEAKNWLRKLRYLKPDLSNGTGEVSYFRYAPPELLPAISISESNFAKVNLFREELDELKILPPDPINSSHSLLS